MPDLVQIGIPPLRQSYESPMSCPTGYVHSVIKREGKPGSIESVRGVQFHRVMSQYASWCAAKGIAQDLAAFDRFAQGVGPQAERLLAGLRDGYTVDQQHLFATELSMSLDANMRPTSVSMEVDSCEDSEEEPVYQGTLDTLYLFMDDAAALIDDFKTHVKPYNPDETLQAKMYPLFVFQHFPWVQSVKFRLVFTRYRNLSREVVYHRSDLRTLMDIVKARRSLQEAIHAEYNAGRDLDVISGSHCGWCPLLSNRECPIGEWNENMQMTPEDWLKWDLWNSAFSRVNHARMKDRVQNTGKPIIIRDYNGKAYRYGAEDKESSVYPLFEATADGIVIDKDGNPSMPVVSLIMDYADMEENADDLAWLGKLVISSTKLESYLKAKKRVHLHQAITDAAEKITKVKMKVSKPLDAEELDDEFDDDDMEEEEL